MSTSHDDPISHPQVQLANVRQYVGAYLVSLILMAVGLGLVQGHLGNKEQLLMIVTACAAGATLVQGYFWLRLDFSRTQRWITTSFWLFVPLFIMTVGLTAWMFDTLYARTMIPSLMHPGALMH